MTHDETIGAIEQLFRGRLASGKADEVSAHVRECEACDRVYQRYAEAERALFEKTPHAEFPAFAQQRVAARLFKEPGVAPKRLPKFLISTATAGALAALALVLFIPRGDFAPRGDQQRLAPSSTLRALALRDEGVVDLASAPLRRGDRLKLLADTGPEQRWASAIIVAEDGRVFATIEPAEIGPNAADAPLGSSILVDDTWPKGQSKIILRLAPDPAKPEPNAEASDRGAISVRILEVRIEEPK
jgi:hypothetical protein